MNLLGKWNWRFESVLAKLIDQHICLLYGKKTLYIITTGKVNCALKDIICLLSSFPHFNAFHVFTIIIHFRIDFNRNN